MCRTVSVALGNSVDVVVRVPSETSGLPSNEREISRLGQSH